MNIKLKNYILMTGLVLLGAIQVLLACVLISNQFPVTSGLYDVVILEWLFMISPERELTYFRLFVVLAVIGQAGAMFFFSQRLKEDGFGGTLRYCLAAEFILTGCLLNAAFQLTVFGPNFVLRQPLFYVLLAVTGVHKLFFYEFKQLLQKVCTVLYDLKGHSWVDIIPVLVIGILFWPLRGGSQHPSFLGGDFTVLLTIVYYWFYYGLLRGWFGQALLSMSCVLITIQLQMFNGIHHLVPSAAAWGGLLLLSAVLLYLRGCYRGLVLGAVIIAGCLMIGHGPWLSAVWLSVNGSGNSTDLMILTELLGRPMVYVVTILLIGGFVYLKKAGREYLFVIAMCVYGLILEGGAILSQVNAETYSLILPFMFILFFWVQFLAQQLQKQWAVSVCVAVFFISAYTLVNNHAFLNYPGLLSSLLYL